MKAEITFHNADISVSTKISDGLLMGTIKAEVMVTPASVARLLNLQKQHARLDVIIESMQAEMDLHIEEVNDKGELIPVGAAMGTTAPSEADDLARPESDD